MLLTCAYLSLFIVVSVCNLALLFVKSPKYKKI